MSEKFRDRLLSQLLARTSYQLSKAFLLAVARRGFTARQWRLLGTLWDEKSLSLTELADAILCSQSTTTRLVERLIELGLIDKQVDAADRRRFQVFITSKGRREIKDLIELALKVEDETTKRLGIRRVIALKAELRSVIETAQRPSSLPPDAHHVRAKDLVE
jgi:DNA-binding MarR family transcriptional regulator